MNTCAYVYKITNKITREYYFGYRSRNQTLGIVPEEDLWKKYFTSSKRIKGEILIHGANNFNSVIIFRSYDPIECWRHEQKLIMDHWGDTLLLNNKYHDPTTMVEVYRRINFHSKESRIKMSLSGRGRQKTELHKKKIALGNTGKYQSPEKRRKISEFRKGKPAHNKGISPPKFNCGHCGKSVSKANLNKWHNDRCRIINPKKFDEVASQIKNLYKIRKML